MDAFERDLTHIKEHLESFREEHGSSLPSDQLAALGDAEHLLNQLGPPVEDTSVPQRGAKEILNELQARSRPPAKKKPVS